MAAPGMKCQKELKIVLEQTDSKAILHRKTFQTPTPQQYLIRLHSLTQMNCRLLLLCQLFIAEKIG